jgi:hypothetical protein
MCGARRDARRYRRAAVDPVEAGHPRQAERQAFRSYLFQSLTQRFVK